MKVKTLRFDFKCEKRVEDRGDKLRGYFASRFVECTLLHNHHEDRLLYKSPLIQYKILGGRPFVLGINEGADVLQSIHPEIDSLKLGEEEYAITEKAIVLRTDEIGMVKEPISYRFLTPWLALNEENYEKYKGMKSWGEKEALLKKILIGNIISVAKGVGYVIPEEIVVSRLKVWPVRTPVKLKGVDMTGFRGEFAVNFEVPDYFGLGKSVSRGFGTIKRIE